MAGQQKIVVSHKSRRRALFPSSAPASFLHFAVAALWIVLLCVAQPAQSQTQAPTEIVNVDLSAGVHPFPHFWERMFGSGRAILSLRESYRRDLHDVKQITGLEYVRFHAIFHDEVGIYGEDGHGTPVYNFSYADQIYDGLLQSGVRPFVELSFMPQKLAAEQTPH